MHKHTKQRYYTIETRLELKKYPQLKEYLDSYVVFYNEVYRYVYRELISPNFKDKYRSKSKFDSHIREKYGLLKRTVNALRNEAEGKIKALKELMNYEKTQLKAKIKTIEKQIKEQKLAINTQKKLVAKNLACAVEIRKYRNTQKSLYFKQRKLNKLNQKLLRLENKINNKHYIITFGGKALFSKQYLLEENNFKTHRTWYKAFVSSRDKNIYYRGSSDETLGNQLFQTSYDENNDHFKVKLRKENRYSQENKYLEFTCDFKYLKDSLKEMLSGSYPLNYRFVRRGKRWYLQVMVILRQEKMLTRSNHGVIGLDFNEGFIELAETDKHGNLVHHELHFIGKHKSGKAKSKLRETLSKISNYALDKGKDLIIEDLDFKRTKGKTITATSKSGKTYNRMIHRLDYSRYKETIEGTSYRLGVGLIKIDPKNTSKIGKQKYSKRMKLNTHQAASYVIARRGQGFKDHLVVN